MHIYICHIYIYIIQLERERERESLRARAKRAQTLDLDTGVCKNNKKKCTSLGHAMRKQKLLSSP